MTTDRAEGMSAALDTAEGRRLLVLQEHPNGCLVACMAMVAGMSYADVAARFPREDLSQHGLVEYHVLDFLSEEGFVVQRFTKYTWTGASKSRDEWPIPMTAEVAICMVDGGRGGENSHGVVLYRDGRVLDPVHGERSWSDYTRVGAMYLIWSAPSASNQSAIDALEALKGDALFNQTPAWVHTYVDRALTHLTGKPRHRLPALLTALDTQRAQIDALERERDELRRLCGLDCDADPENGHSVISQPDGYQFCHKCGITIKEARRRRAALPARVGRG